MSIVNDIHDIRTNQKKLGEVIRVGDLIGFDFSRTPMVAVVGIIHNLMWNGIDDPQSIFEFLAERNWSGSPEDLITLLGWFEASDVHDGLWRREASGRYLLVPAPADLKQAA